MRHGQAEGYIDADSTRQLTDLGRQQAAQTAAYLLEKYTPDRFVVSPYDRAQQTLAAFTKLAPKTPITVLKDIIPSGNATNAIEQLAELEAECLLVVCHMPIVANMAGTLIGEFEHVYALAEARVIEADVLYAGLGTQIDGFIPDQ